MFVSFSAVYFCFVALYLDISDGHKISFNFILCTHFLNTLLNGLRQANLVLIAYVSSEGSGEPAHPRSLARTFAARSYKQFSQEEPSDRKPDPWPLWMAGHA